MPPETSIVIRTLNEGKHLEKVFQGIHMQNYRDWEIILVDSGSTDRTLDIAREYGANIHHIPAQEFTYGRSLNLGCREAQGDYLVFVSGHVWPITNNWLGNLVEPFREPSVAMVYGRQRGTDVSRLSELHDLQGQFGPVSHILVDEPKGNNGNAAIRKELWLRQPFDESLPGLEDVDWARKAVRRGYRVYYAADASVYHVHEETIRQVYRRHRREAVASKRMFPHNRFTWSDVFRGLPYFILRDVLFAFRQSKRGKVFQVPGTRIAQFLGMHQGMRYQKRLSRELINRLSVPDTYQRVVVEGPARHALTSANIPSLEPDEVLVQVAYAGVNAGDPKTANGQSIGSAAGSVGYPFVPGQESAGIVVKSGSRASHLKKGQKVAGQGIIPFGRFAKKEAGSRNTGLGTPAGAYAQYVVVHHEQLNRLPEDMSLKYGLLVPSVASCLSALRAMGAGPGRRVCVVGAGPLANLCAQVLGVKGLKVTSVASNPTWLSLVHKYDVDTHTELGALDKYDYLVDATEDEGEPAAPVGQSEVMIVRLGPPRAVPGQGSPANVAGSGISADVYRNGWRVDWQEAVRLVLGGAVNLEDHTTAVQPLEAYQAVWDRMESQQHFKVLLSVSKELEPL